MNVEMRHTLFLKPEKLLKDILLGCPVFIDAQLRKFLHTVN